MSASAEAIQLKEALQSQEQLKLRGFSATCGDNDSVVIDRWGHCRGVWRIYSGQYFWIGGASSQPLHCAATYGDAIAYTLTVIAAI